MAKNGHTINQHLFSLALLALIFPAPQLASTKVSKESTPYITLLTARSEIFLPAAILRVALCWLPRKPTVFARLARWQLTDNVVLINIKLSVQILTNAERSLLVTRMRNAGTTLARTNVFVRPATKWLETFVKVSQANKIAMTTHVKCLTNEKGRNNQTSTKTKIENSFRFRGTNFNFRIVYFNTFSKKPSRLMFALTNFNEYECSMHRERQESCLLSHLVMNGKGLLVSFFFLIDIDECSTGEKMCHKHASCIDTEGSYKCECKPGYNGDGKQCTGRKLRTNEGAKH